MNRLRYLGPLLLAGLALLGPPLSGPATPPTLGATAAQLLPPGRTVQEVRLAGGGFVRAVEIGLSDAGIRIKRGDEWRTVPGPRAVEPVRSVTLWLGSDHQGRSILARVTHGARTSLVVAVVATLVATLLGTTVGLAAALAPVRVRSALEIVTDGLLGVPRVLLLLMLGIALRGSPSGLGFAIGLASWMEISRLVQSEGLALGGHPFVSAAVAAGAGRMRLAVRHFLPNLAPILRVAAPLVATQAILLEATLSFLGVTSHGESASWGRIVADGHRLLPDGWWIVVFPGAMLCITALAVHGLARTGSEDVRHLVSP